MDTMGRKDKRNGLKMVKRMGLNRQFFEVAEMMVDFTEKVPDYLIEVRGTLLNGDTAALRGAMARIRNDASRLTYMQQGFVSTVNFVFERTGVRTNRIAIQVRMTESITNEANEILAMVDKASEMTDDIHEAAIRVVSMLESIENFQSDVNRFVCDVDELSWSTD